MATHSSTFAWRIPWTEEPNGLESMGSQRVRQGFSNLAHMHTLLICGKKTEMNLFTKQRVTDVENKLVVTTRDGGKDQEAETDTHTLIM